MSTSPPHVPPAVLTAALDTAAEALRRAEALLVTAGAGMGVDSGLPDFRGTEGFWNAYPPYRQLGLRFEELANPRWFDEDPTLAWGFYGHRLGLYRVTVPHAGFQQLRHWGDRVPGGMFVFTSNVDGQFQKAGVDAHALTECHGSIHHLQCVDATGPACRRIWEAPGVGVAVSLEGFRAQPPLPRCPGCGGLARPNVLMFGDGAWLDQRTAEQQDRMAAWLRKVRGGRLVVVECGAGTGVPTVRLLGEQMVRACGATLIRINVREPQVPPGQVGLALGAREALALIQSRLG